MRINKGFTLLEILIALFVFSILSLLLTSALRTVINANEGTDKSAERLRQTQLALFMLSRDVEQVVNRPVLSASGQEEAAFIGEANKMTFTRAGVADPTNKSGRSGLSRMQYIARQDGLWRDTWAALDAPPDAKPSTRLLLANARDIHFEYLDNDRVFQKSWPVSGKKQYPLPKAIRVFITIPNWGTISQLYIISAEVSNVPIIPPKP